MEGFSKILTHRQAESFSMSMEDEFRADQAQFLVFRRYQHSIIPRQME